MLATALGRHRGNGALDQLQQRLLHALSGHVPGDGGIVGLARNLVYLIDVDDTHLGLLDIIVALLQEFLDDVLDILPDVTRLGQGGGVGNGEGHVQQARQGFGQQCLAAARRPDEQDIALAQLHVLGPALAVTQALVMVVHGHREDFLGPCLADDILVENRVDLARYRQMVLGAVAAAFLHFFADDVVAQVHALITDEYRWPGNQFANLVLAFTTEGTVQQLAAFAGVGGVVAHSTALRPETELPIISATTMMTFAGFCKSRWHLMPDILDPNWAARTVANSPGAGLTCP